MSLLLFTAFLVGVKWHLTMVLTGTSLTISDADCFFICLLAICVFSLEKDLLRSFGYFPCDFDGPDWGLRLTLFYPTTRD